LQHYSAYSDSEETKMVNRSPQVTSSCTLSAL